jgi:hypothetical protein
VVERRAFNRALALILAAALAVIAVAPASASGGWDRLPWPTDVIGHAIR